MNRGVREPAGDRLDGRERIADRGELARFKRQRMHRGDTGDRGGTVESSGLAQQRDFSFDERFDSRGEHGAGDFDADARADAHASTDEPHVSVGRLAKGDSPQMFRNPRQHHRFVCRCDRIAPGSREQGGFLVGDILERAETLAVLEVDVEDHCDVWLDDLRQFWNLAAGVGAAFEDGRAMLAGKRENRHRYADQIVQIARG